MGPALRPVLAVVAFVALIHGAWWLLGDQIVAQGGLADGDGYSRLLRVERLVETGAWFDSSLPRAGAPFGVSLHWTRPLDVLLIALALPLAPFMGLTAALYWAGVVVGPLLHVGLAVALAWAMMPLLGAAAAAIAGALTAVQFGILGFAVVGHADHHMMFVLIAAGALGFMVRALSAADGGRRPAFWAGAVLALGLWVGPEMLLFLALCLAVGGLAWVTGEDGAGRMNLNLALGLTAGLMAALLIERGPGGFLDVEYDRVSVAHLTLAALLLVFWRGVAMTAPGRRRAVGRLAVGILGAAMTVALMQFLYPKFFANPVAGVDPALLPIQAMISDRGSISGVGPFLVYLGGSLFAVPWAAWRLKEEWRRGPGYAWLLVGLALLVTLGLALGYVRWSLYAGLFLTVPLADLLAHVDETVNRRFSFPSRTPVKAAAVLFLVMGPLVAGGGVLYAAKAPESGQPAEAGRCSVAALARFLNRPPWGDAPRTIVASANFGAEILYRTKHRVVATVSHRNAAGFLDGHGILAGADEARVLALIRKRRVDIIVLCPGSRSDRYFLTGGEKGALYRRLVGGDVPGWMGEVDLPGGLGGFRLFRVSPP